jgi:hypothetical protein
MSVGPAFPPFTTIQKFSGRVGVSPAGPGVSPGRTSRLHDDAPPDSERPFGQDAQTGGQDAHPTREENGGALSNRRNLVVQETEKIIYACRSFFGFGRQ